MDRGHNRLLTFMGAVTSQLDIDAIVRTLVHAAVTVTDARYGAVIVLGPHRSAAEVVTEGLDEATRARIGAPPRLDGILGMVLERTEPLRLDDLTIHPAGVGFPPHHPPMRTFLGVPIRVRGDTFGSLNLAEKTHGRPFTHDDAIMALALCAAAGFAIENARLHRRSHMHRQWLEATRDIATELLAGTSVDDVLQLIAEKFHVLSGASHVTLAVPPDGDLRAAESNELWIAATTDSACGSALGESIPLAGPLGRLFRRRSPLLVEKLEHGFPYGSALALPLSEGSQIIGTLLALRSDSVAPFNEEHLELGAMFADYCTLALRISTNQRRIREFDVVSERERIARDLHDQVIQRLFAAGLALQGTQQRTESAEIRGRLTDSIDTLQTIIEDIRTVVFDLREGRPHSRPLRQRLGAIITELTASTKISVTVHISGRFSDIDGSLADHAEAVLREALANAVRHAAAQGITIRVALTDHQLTVEVVDDGTGIPADSPRNGLDNLADRARKVGGSLTVTNLASGGTRLVWSAPCQRTEPS